MEQTKIFYVSVTGIVVKGGKFLITKRNEKEKAFPGRWTVPGGKFQQTDYLSLKQNSGGLWYEVVESALKRELREEVSLEIANIRYLTSIAYVRPDDAHCLILSFFCDCLNGEVKLNSALTEFAWVTLDEAKQYDLIEGIYEELQLVANALK